MWSRRRDESGAVAVIVALCLMMFMTVLALVLDIGHIETVRSELQNAADASVLAGVRSLLPPVPPGNQVMTFTGTPSCATAILNASTLINAADTQPLAIASGDIQLGHWGWPSEPFPLNQFTPLAGCSTNVNALQVTTRKDQTLNQPVTTWFARVFGIDTVNVVSRPAVAALGFVNGVEAGRVFPIAINQSWLEQQLKLPVPEGGIQFNPDGKDNGGWAAPLDEPASGDNMKKWIDSGYPEKITVDDLINLNNGTIDSAMSEVEKQLPSHTQTYTLHSNGLPYDGWLVVAPVVEVDKFNRSTKIVAYEPMIIMAVNAQGKTKTIQVVFYDKPVIVDGGLPGGVPSNLLANIPRLVQ